MGSRKHISRKDISASAFTPKPKPNILQTRPFSSGKHARSSELPKTDVLQTRPFSNPSQKSSGAEAQPLTPEAVEKAEVFGYKAASIPAFAPTTPQPTIQREEVTEEDTSSQSEAETEEYQPIWGFARELSKPQSEEVSPQSGTIQLKCDEFGAEKEEEKHTETIQTKAEISEAKDYTQNTFESIRGDKETYIWQPKSIGKIDTKLLARNQQQGLSITKAKPSRIRAKKLSELVGNRETSSKPEVASPQSEVAATAETKELHETIQAKLTVGEPGDKYEQEADAVARQVISMPEPVVNQPIQREAVAEENVEEVQDKPIAASITPQSWIDPALTAIEEGRFKDALQAYDEGISLNPDITSAVDRGKLDILKRDEEAPLQSENEEESAPGLENQTEIASDPGIFSNLPPWEPRPDSNSEKPNDEPQRLEAIRIVTSNAQFICQIAAENNVTPDAIAGAILWEGIENPYSRTRVGPTRTNIPGKIHPYPGDVAEAIEQEGRVPPLNSRRPQIGPYGPRTERLRDPRWAIRYIGVILDRAAEFYEGQANARGRKPYNIRDQAGILGTLYQGGDAEGRAERFENRRDLDPRAVPRMDPDEKMGPWISQYRWWIQQLLQENGCDPKGFIPEGEMGPVPPLHVPIPNPFYPESGA